jgi:hypothetical protein
MDKPQYFRTEIRRLLVATAFVGFYVNLMVFDLLIEIVLQPLVLLLVLVTEVSRRRPDRRAVERFGDRLLGAVGLGLIVFVTVKLVADWDTVNPTLEGKKLVLPLWLSAGLLPFVYAVALSDAYRVAWRWAGDTETTLKQRLKCLAVVGLSLRFSARDVSRIRPHDVAEIFGARTHRERLAAAAGPRRRRLDRERCARERAERFRRHAGTPGTDRDGRVIDRREIRDTRNALELIAGAQRNWYTRLDGRYRDDIVELFAPYVGLPIDHGMVSEVADDRRSWAVGRRLPSGHWLAIGSHGPPTEERRYSGAEAPAWPIDNLWRRSNDDVADEWEPHDYD